MKNTMAVGLLMLGLGFAIGWMAKPTPTGSADAKVTASKSSQSQPSAGGTSPSEAGLKIRRTERPPVAKDPSQPTDEQIAQGKKVQGEMMKSMVKRMRSKFEAQIEKLSENLNLTPAQKDSLTALLDERMKALEKLDFSDPKSMEGMGEELKGLTTQAFEDQLASSLTEDQKVALTDFKAKELQAKVDTTALKSLSQLQGVIEFEDGQRDEVYKILTENAEAEAIKEAATPNLMELMTADMGFEMDPYDLNLQEAMTDAIGIDGSKMTTASPNDQKTMAKNLREIIDQRIDAKVESLRPVLNDKQLEQYRGELKTKGLGVFGPMLNAMDAED